MGHCEACAAKGLGLIYRPEIDGLRAVAVIPVLLFHAGVSAFSGGYVGVDIFFVLSGYLITTIIWNDLERGRFTFRNFYERRIRRIVPALLLVLIATLAGGLLWLPPDRLAELGQSAATALFSVSNFYFYSEAGYFARASEEQPLLHTWSLGVEEQFYLLFPILLLVLHRRLDRPTSMAVLSILALASFAWCEWLWRNDPDANFFLIPSRAWELLAGSLCALHLYKRKSGGSVALASLGLGLLAMSFVVMEKTTPFPSAYTLLPVVGTVLVVLFARGENAIARLLSVRPLVGLGLISYSTYLWHQPLLAFARLRAIEHPSLTLMLALCVLSVILAYLSWKYVEQPFRKAKPEKSSLDRFTSVPAVLATLVLIAFGSNLLSQSGGVPQRFGIEKARIYESSRQLPPSMRRCKTGYTDTDPVICQEGERQSPKFRIALVGDSHASQWTDSLREIAERNDWSVDTFAKSSCPLAEIDFYLPYLKREYAECRDWRKMVRRKIRAEKFDLVIATQSSLSYLRHHGDGNIGREHWTAGMAQFAQWADTLPGNWILLSDNPQFRRNSPTNCVARTVLMDLAAPELCSEEREIALDADSRDMERSLAQGSQKGQWLDLAFVFCDESKCRPHRQGQLVMSDSNHLSVSGTEFGSAHLESAIQSSLFQ